METPTITAYYREIDPQKRKALLEEAIRTGEEPEANEIRKELWEIRYKDRAEGGKDARADGYFRMWMALEYNKDAKKKFFGGNRGARKEIGKHLKELKFKEFQEKGGLYEELLYRECCHLVKTYMELCEKDKSYNSTLYGILNISSERAKEKLKQDIHQIAIELPAHLQMEQELSILTRAAREMYALHFPGEGSLSE
jgi:hypothetical protein